jgi:hypothetical protein
MFLVAAAEAVAVARRPGDGVQRAADVGRDLAGAAAQGLASMLISRLRSRRLIWLGRWTAARRPPATGARRAGCRRRAAHHQRQVAAGRPGRRAVGRQAHAHVVGLAVAARQLPTVCRPPGCAACWPGVDVQAQVGGGVAPISTATVGLSGLSVLSRSTRPGMAAQLRSRSAATGAPARPGRRPGSRTACVLLPPRSVTPMLVTVMPECAPAARAAAPSAGRRCAGGPCGRPGARRRCRRSCPAQSRC